MAELAQEMDKAGGLKDTVSCKVLASSSLVALSFVQSSRDIYLESLSQPHRKKAIISPLPRSENRKSCFVWFLNLFTTSPTLVGESCVNLCLRTDSTAECQESAFCRLKATGLTEPGTSYAHLLDWEPLGHIPSGSVCAK